MRHDTLEFALALAEAAEAEIMPRFRNCLVSWKSDGSEVTDADRRAEEVMREMIERRFPGHLVLGEEYGGPPEPVEKPLWVLDPVDGTTSFTLGLPMFGTLIAYMERGEPQVGVIHLPAMGETLYAAKGEGCWLRRRGGEAVQLHVSRITLLEKAFVSASDGFSALGPMARKVRTISDCVQHALVAQGRIDAAIDPVMHPWDIAALVPCVEEAGGVVSDLEGVRDQLVWRSSLLSTSSPALHKEVLQVLRG